MLFRSGDHAQAVARIGYGITTRGIAVITGEVGVGKTVAARAAIERAEPARHHLIYIPDPTVGARGIYHHFVSALGGRPSWRASAFRTADQIRSVPERTKEIGAVGNWVRKYRADHAGDEPPLQLSERARLRELERENRELAMENAFLKKAAAYFAKEQR